MVKLAGTLVLVGAGKMGGAMLEGWLAGGADPTHIVALDPAPPPEMKALLQRHDIRLNPDVSTITDAEVVIIAVKPQLMEDVLPGIATLKSSKPLVLSVAAGRGMLPCRWHRAGAPAACCLPHRSARGWPTPIAACGDCRVRLGAPSVTTASAAEHDRLLLAQRVAAGA